jgi:hypothetical protein
MQRGSIPLARFCQDLTHRNGIDAACSEQTLGSPFDVVPSSTTATTVVFSSTDDMPGDLAAGDYTSAAETSPVINWLPNEAQPLLESYCAQRVCQRIGDFDGAKAIEADIAAEEKSLEEKAKQEKPRTLGPCPMGFAWIKVASDAIEACCQYGCLQEIGMGGPIGQP